MVIQKLTVFIKGARMNFRAKGRYDMNKDLTEPKLEPDSIRMKGIVDPNSPYGIPWKVNS
jgi:hypothetical protein